MSLPASPQPLALSPAAAKRGAGNSEYWRTLEELSQSPQFRALLEREFPQQAAGWGEDVDRRRFLALMGASLALAGLSGCGMSQAPVEHIRPYVRQPERVIPGRPLYFATAMPLAGYATGGLLVESHLGRPTKVEGNPDHPCSPRPRYAPATAQFGPSDVFAQASILSLYDPDRSHAVQHLGSTSTWDAFRAALLTAVARRPAEEVRLRLLTGSVTSPTLADQIQAILRRFPRARWHQWEPTAGHELEGARLAFGRPVGTQYRFHEADVVLSLGADFLACGAGHLLQARDFMDRRRYWSEEGRPDMNRLYVVESMPTTTGAKADHRVPLPASRMELFAQSVAGRLGLEVGGADDQAFALPAGWLDALAHDLRAHDARSLVLAGAEQPPIVHALAHAMNQRLGSVGRTVVYTAPIAVPPSAPAEAAALHEPTASLRALLDDLDDGVDALLILGANPVYDAPADLRFIERFERAGLRIHLGDYFDETAAYCHWHIPQAHFLESWGDVRAHDGTVTIMQPLIAPLYNGQSALEVLAALGGASERTGYEIVRAHWQHVSRQADDVKDELKSYARLRPTNDFEDWWERSLNAGFIAGTEAPPIAAPRARQDHPRLIGLAHGGSAPGQPRAPLELEFRPDPSVHDGRFANNGWLQELPRPLTKIVWDNVASMSAATAVTLGLAPSLDRATEANGRVVALRCRERLVDDVPVWVMPGHADDCITVTLGYGRREAGRVAGGVGYNAYAIRTAQNLWQLPDVRVEPTGRQATIATTQHHHLMDNRGLVHSSHVDDYEHARAQQRHERQQARISLYPPPPESQPNQWGMTIDLNVCTGCQACVLACVAENNIPVVGKDQVARGREMHWLRIDSYYKGSPERPRALETYFHPVPCMHCENAPCELVCPVEATVHSSDGLNDMVYNRCVGTRYCSNNCPYKVRRFNFLQYADFATEAYRAMRNPDVSVRSRGVMEKCTYCVQRIRATQIQAQLEDRGIRDFEVMTACQSACPAGAIIFGDLNQPRSGAARSRAHDLNYGLLAELNTRPRTTYLWALRNPNERITALEARG